MTAITARKVAPNQASPATIPTTNLTAVLAAFNACNLASCYIVRRCPAQAGAGPGVRQPTGGGLSHDPSEECRSGRRKRVRRIVAPQLAPPVSAAGRVRLLSLRRSSHASCGHAH